MNGLGNMHGRFFWSIITDEKFIGLAFRIGIEEVGAGIIFHSTLILGSFQFTIGFIIKK